MKEKLLLVFVQILMSMADAETLKRLADGVLDIAEDAAMKSSNQVDDKVVLPLCAKLREVFAIPDNDPA